MTHRRIIATAAALVAFSLAGCTITGPTNLDQAYQECQTKVTPQFDDPASVTWSDDNYDFAGNVDDGILNTVVDEGEKQTRVTCFVTQTTSGWELTNYEFSEPIDEVVE